MEEVRFDRTECGKLTQLGGTRPGGKDGSLTFIETANHLGKQTTDMTTLRCTTKLVLVGNMASVAQRVTFHHNLGDKIKKHLTEATRKFSRQQVILYTTDWGLLFPQLLNERRLYLAPS